MNTRLLSSDIPPRFREPCKRINLLRLSLRGRVGRAAGRIFGDFPSTFRSVSGFLVVVVLTGSSAARSVIEDGVVGVAGPKTRVMALSLGAGAEVLDWCFRLCLKLRRASSSGGMDPTVGCMDFAVVANVWTIGSGETGIRLTQDTVMGAERSPKRMLIFGGCR